MSDTTNAAQPGYAGQLIEDVKAVDGGTIFVRGTFLSREEAEEAVAAYMRDYPPEGYGTGFTPIMVAYGYFIVRGYRSSSCD